MPGENFKEIEIQTEFGQYAAKLCGEGAQKRLLAIHGWLDNANSFDRIAPYLAEKYEIISIDLPGHGKTFHRDVKSPHHFVDYIYDVIHILEFFETQQITLLGHSMGGGIATLVAAIAPEKIERLILLDAPGPISKSLDTTVSRLKGAVEQYRGLKNRKESIYKDLEQAAKLRAEINKISESDAKLLVERGMQESEEGFRWITDQRLMILSPLSLLEDQVIEFIKKIRCETLYFEATESKIYSQEVIKNRLRSFENLKHFRINAPHHLHINKAKEVAELILN